MPGPTLRLGHVAGGDLHVETDAEREEYCRLKLEQFGHWDNAQSRGLIETNATQWLADTMRRERELPVIASSNLDTLVADIQEDFVIMHRRPGTSAVQGKAVYVNVAFPSGWCPQCAPGRSFLALHGPVPVAPDFDGPARKTLADLVFPGETLVRFVWTLTPDTALDRRRCHRTPASGAAHRSTAFDWRATRIAHLRVERQVFAPIDADTTCFLIRVYRYPVSALEAAQRSKLRTALHSMPNDVRTYKGLANDFEHIMSLL